MRLRVPQLFDSVVVVDRSGRQGTALVCGLQQPGRPDGEVVVRPSQGLAGDWSRPWPFSATPRPGHWSWPTAAAADPLATHAFAPRRGDRIQVVQGGRLVGATVAAVDDFSSPRSPVVACVDGDYLGGQPAERRFRYSEQPREGCWCW